MNYNRELVEQWEIHKQEQKKFNDFYGAYKEKILDCIPEDKKEYWENRIDNIKSLQTRLDLMENLYKKWVEPIEKHIQSEKAFD